ncbi:unnamed protein product [Polarella glacialis]|uniref:Inositol polyphosphate-related phosphatase domain-containing protein n=1 Tax=Polarella glacialis TaxID=89957 RepID=A0A813FRI2_POLGL|nr:unnamed protein product [Polarella glacialis]
MAAAAVLTETAPAAAGGSSSSSCPGLPAAPAHGAVWAPASPLQEQSPREYASLASSSSDEADSSPGRKSKADEAAEDNKASNRSPSLESLPQVDGPAEAEAVSTAPVGLSSKHVPAAAPQPAYNNNNNDNNNNINNINNSNNSNNNNNSNNSNNGSSPQESSPKESPSAKGLGMKHVRSGAPQAASEEPAAAAVPRAAGRSPSPPGGLLDLVNAAAADTNARPAQRTAKVSEELPGSVAPVAQAAGPGAAHCAALQASSGSALHHWPEVELPQVSQRADQAIRLFCGVWNLHGKHAPADLNQWLTKCPRHHVYVIGTCECERSIQKSMLWANKANWERQAQNHFGEDYRMVGAQNMSAIHVMVFVHKYLWKYCWDVKTGTARFFPVPATLGSGPVLPRRSCWGKSEACVFKE